MNVRFLIAAPVALFVSAAFIGAATPAFAADATCASAPARIRTIAASAQPDQARKALGLVSLGEKLCAEGGRFEAGKKFSAAAKVLGTDMAALQSAAPTAQ